MTQNVSEMSASRFELLVQSVTDYAIYMLSPTGVVTSWNAGAQRFKGYAPDEIIGDHFSRFYTPEDKAAGIPQTALRTAEAEGRFEAEGWRVRKDGTRFWANVVIDPIRDPDGELVGFAKITRDLTERKAAEEKLRRSEERFRLLIQSVNDYAIYMLNPDGTVASWNPGAERFKGYRADEIIGEHFSRFYTPEDKEAGIPALALRTAEDEGKFEAEGWRMRKDGTRFWASVVIDRIMGEDGELLGFAKITRDLSERKKAQEELEETKERFLQSQKMEAIGKLTGGVAHDFNNLLSVILGSLHLAQRRLSEGGDISRLITNSLQAAERGASLTQRMLAFARKQELQTERVDLSDLVGGMAELLERTIGPGIEIETRFPHNLPAVHADPRQLELALMNLFVNARDAMPAGGTITISAMSETAADTGDLKSGNYVRLVVADEGEGMSEETLARAIEPFFTTKGIGKGTGLGLPMVQGLAMQSGGKFSLASQMGKGTTADLWFPVSDTVALPIAAAPAHRVEATKRLHVLAVDDDALVLSNTVTMLQELGHVVTEVGSGREALNLMREARPDLLVTDYAMPGMTGEDLAKLVKAEFPGLPILMVSGYADLAAGTVSETFRLAKPFNEAALATAIAHVVGNGPSSSGRPGQISDRPLWTRSDAPCSNDGVRRPYPLKEAPIASSKCEPIHSCARSGLRSAMARASRR